MLAFAGDLRAPLVYTLHHAVDPALTRLYRRVPGVSHVAISARQAELADPAPRHVVHHGLDPELYPMLGPGGDAAFFLGRLAPCKAPDLAVEAARRARVPLVVAGKFHAGDCPQGWQEQLSAALREPHVRWAPEVDLAAKRRRFARSRALLMPLRWEEPFGLVVIESLLAGCPVVATPRGAVPELVEDGVDGFLVEDVRAMAAALRRAPALDRRHIQERARARFSSDRMAEGYAAVYRAAVAEYLRGREVAPPDAGVEGWTTVAQ
jgi:glycosyltransferase involved in cell wall biosynthesis